MACVHISLPSLLFRSPRENCRDKSIDIRSLVAHFLKMDAELAHLRVSVFIIEENCANDIERINRLHQQCTYPCHCS